MGPKLLQKFGFEILALEKEKKHRRMNSRRTLAQKRLKCISHGKWSFYTHVNRLKIIFLKPKKKLKIFFHQNKFRPKKFIVFRSKSVQMLVITVVSENRTKKFRLKIIFFSNISIYGVFGQGVGDPLA